MTYKALYETLNSLLTSCSLLRLVANEGCCCYCCWWWWQYTNRSRHNHAVNFVYRFTSERISPCIWNTVEPRTLFRI